MLPRLFNVRSWKNGLEINSWTLIWWRSAAWRKWLLRCCGCFAAVVGIVLVVFFGFVSAVLLLLLLLIARLKFPLRTSKEEKPATCGLFFPLAFFVLQCSCPEPTVINNKIKQECFLSKQRGVRSSACAWASRRALPILSSQPASTLDVDRPKGQNGEGQDTKIGDDNQPEAVKTSDEEPKHDLGYKEAVVEGVFWPRGAPRRRGTRCWQAWWCHNVSNNSDLWWEEGSHGAGWNQKIFVLLGCFLWNFCLSLYHVVSENNQIDYDSVGCWGLAKRSNGKCHEQNHVWFVHCCQLSSRALHFHGIVVLRVEGWRFVVPSHVVLVVLCWKVFFMVYCAFCFPTETCMANWTPKTTKHFYTLYLYP